jgi:hypothetical protein
MNFDFENEIHIYKGKRKKLDGISKDDRKDM